VSGGCCARSGGPGWRASGSFALPPRDLPIRHAIDALDEVAELLGEAVLLPLVIQEDEALAEGEEGRDLARMIRHAAR
jgi:hypothetical protein